MRRPIEEQINYLESKIQLEDDSEQREMLINCKQSLKDFKAHTTSEDNNFNVVVTMSENSYKKYFKYKKEERKQIS